MDNRAFFWFRATSVISENCDYLGKIRKQSWATLEMRELQISRIFQSNLFCSPTFKVIDRKIIQRCCQDPQNKQSRAKKKKKIIKNSKVSYQQNPAAALPLAWGEVTQMLSAVWDSNAVWGAFVRFSHLVLGHWNRPRWLFHLQVGKRTEIPYRARRKPLTFR